MPEDSAVEITSAPELDNTSESAQMYLITVARAAESGKTGPVPISSIAATLGVSVPSANEMIRKLDDRGLVTYEPYRGVQLSEAGHRIADQVLRTRRLWATFLVDHLGFSPSDADEQACHLEHVTNPEVADRLATFLGNPAAGPLGRPIPTSGGTGRHPDRIRLNDLPVGVPAEVIAVQAPDHVLSFLDAEGLTAARRLQVTASGASGVLVELEHSSVHLDPEIASTILIHVDVSEGDR